jgi:hypothetical protein
MRIFGTGRTEFRFFPWGELVAFTSIEDARAAVVVHRKDPRIMARFRALLWETGGLSKREDDVAEEIAQLLSKGKLVTERLPFHPYWRREEALGERDFARQFLSEFQRNPVVLDGFRSQFCKRNAESASHCLTDAEVIAGMARLLRSGDLVVGYYAPPSWSFKRQDSPPQPAEEPPEGAAIRAGASSPAEEEEQTPFEDGDKQAATLNKAAQTGAPFCEVCQRG